MIISRSGMQDLKRKDDCRGCWMHRNPLTKWDAGMYENLQRFHEVGSWNHKNPQEVFI